MDDSLLDLSDDQLLVQETQMENSPATFSRKIINRLGIVGHPITGSETVDPTQQTPIPISYWYWYSLSNVHTRD